MSRCARVRDLLGSYIGDDLGERERHFVASHLLTCRRCAEELRTCQRLLDRLPSDTETMLPSDVRARVLGRVQVRRRELVTPRPSFLSARTARGLVFAASVGAAAVVALWLIFPPATRRPPTTSGVVGESNASGPSVVVPENSAPPPTPQVQPPPVSPAPLNVSPPSVGLQPTPTTRHFARRRPAVRKHAKKPKEKEEAVAPEPQKPEKDVVAPTPKGPDDATVIPSSE